MAWSLKREVVRGSPLACLYRKHCSLVGALKELRAQLVDDSERKPALKAELRTLMNGLIQSLAPKETTRWARKARSSYPGLPNYAAARQHFNSWLEEAKTAPVQSVRAQLAAEFKLFVPLLILAYENPRNFFLHGPPQSPVNGPDLGDRLMNDWRELAESIREWGLGVLLDPATRRVLDEIDGETINQFLAMAESREEFRPGRPPGDSEELARKATEALEDSREYFAGSDPGQRKEDLSLYSEEEQAARKAARKRAPSAMAATYARAAKDIEKSKRTARRYRAKSPR